MRPFLIIVISMMLANSVYAANEVVLGLIRQSTAENMQTGNRSPVRPGFGLGLKTESEMWSSFSIKIGLMYEERKVSDIFFGIEHFLELKNAELLTHVSYKLNDFISVFGGPSYSVLLSSQCKPTSGACRLSEDAKKYFIPVVLGFEFNFGQSYAAELFYESISQEIWEKTFQKSQAYGLNLKYKF